MIFSHKTPIFFSFGLIHVEESPELCVDDLLVIRLPVFFLSWMNSSLGISKSFKYSPVSSLVNFLSLVSYHPHFHFTWTIITLYLHHSPHVHLPFFIHHKYPARVHLIPHHIPSKPKRKESFMHS